MLCIGGYAAEGDAGVGGAREFLLHSASSGNAVGSYPKISSFSKKQKFGQTLGKRIIPKISLAYVIVN